MVWLEVPSKSCKRIGGIGVVGIWNFLTIEESKKQCEDPESRRVRNVVEIDST